MIVTGGGVERLDAGDVSTSLFSEASMLFTQPASPFKFLAAY